MPAPHTAAQIADTAEGGVPQPAAFAWHAEAQSTLASAGRGPGSAASIAADGDEVALASVAALLLLVAAASVVAPPPSVAPPSVSPGVRS